MLSWATHSQKSIYSKWVLPFPFLKTWKCTVSILHVVVTLKNVSWGGLIPLHNACSFGHAEVVSLLLRWAFNSSSSSSTLLLQGWSGSKRPGQLELYAAARSIYQGQKRCLCDAPPGPCHHTLLRSHALNVYRMIWMVWIIKITFECNNCSTVPIQAYETPSRKQHWTWRTHSLSQSSRAQIIRRTIYWRLLAGEMRKKSKAFDDYSEIIDFWWLIWNLLLLMTSKICSGNEEKLLALLTPLNVNCHASDGRKSTPLHLAAGYNRTRIVQLLLTHGADVHAKDKGGLVPLHNACSYGHFEVMKMSKLKRWQRYMTSDIHERTRTKKQC